MLKRAAGAVDEPVDGGVSWSRRASQRTPECEAVELGVLERDVGVILVGLRSPPDAWGVVVGALLVGLRVQPDLTVTRGALVDGVLDPCVAMAASSDAGACAHGRRSARPMGPLLAPALHLMSV